MLSARLSSVALAALTLLASAPPPPVHAQAAEVPHPGRRLLPFGRKPPAVAPSAALPMLTDADFVPVDPNNLLVIETNQGRILVEMTPEAAPAHVERIRTLAKQHFYDGQTFFRVVDQFMAQTGDPKNQGDGGSTLPDLQPEFTFRRGPSTPFAIVATPAGAEVGFVGVLPVMSQSSQLMGLTADGKVSAWGEFCPGVAGMARADKVDSANSQFFFMRQAYPSLEKRYTAWGQVVSGLDVVRAIKAGEPVPAPQDKMITLRLASDLPEAQRPKVRVANPASPNVKTLIDAARALKGADFSICDVTLPSKVG